MSQTILYLDMVPREPIQEMKLAGYLAARAPGTTTICAR